MDDREGLRERVRDVSADGLTWWSWWWFNHTAFLSVSIFNSKIIIFLLHPNIDLDLWTPYLWVEFSFVILEGPVLNMYCLTLSRYHLSLISFANVFWFISSWCINRLLCGWLFSDLFLPLDSSACFSSLAVSFVVAASLLTLLFSVLIQVLYFCSDSFSEFLFFHWLVLLLHELTRSVRWCCPFGYVVRLDMFQ